MGRSGATDFHCIHVYHPSADTSTCRPCCCCYCYCKVVGRRESETCVPQAHLLLLLLLTPWCRLLLCAQSTSAASTFQNQRRQGAPCTASCLLQQLAPLPTGSLVPPGNALRRVVSGRRSWLLLWQVVTLTRSGDLRLASRCDGMCCSSPFQPMEEVVNAAAAGVCVYVSCKYVTA
jgi:hypothetical protein